MAVDYTDYIELLPSQYQKSPQVIRLVEIFLEKMEELNLAQQDFDRTSTDIDLATGHALDLIGNLIGAGRGGRDDVAYRDFIRYTITVNSGSGTAEDLFIFLLSATSGTNVKLWEYPNASLILETNGSYMTEAIAVNTDNAAAGGVKVKGVIHSPATMRAFRPVEVDDLDLYRSAESYLTIGVYDPLSGGILAEEGEGEIEVEGNIVTVETIPTHLSGQPEMHAGDSQANAGDFRIKETNEVEIETLSLGSCPDFFQET